MAGRESFVGAASIILVIFPVSRWKARRFSAVDAGGGCSAFFPEIPNPFENERDMGAGTRKSAWGNSAADDQKHSCALGQQPIARSEDCRGFNRPFLERPKDAPVRAREKPHCIFTMNHTNQVNPE